MKPACGAAELLRTGGPVRVPLRECCAAALIGVDSGARGCEALEALEMPPVKAEPPVIASP